MNHNQSGLHANNLGSHASLLLSASPTIITSALQNNTKNSQSPPSTIVPARRQPSTPLLVFSNQDNESHINTDSPLNIGISEEFINFKKPQNEMFKKLDGKIQKIVAAHSNLNKLYALNEFSSFGSGPKRPFELPPQLPPPPPWVPKVVGEFDAQWNDEIMSPLNPLNEPLNTDMANFKPGPSMFESTSNSKNLSQGHPFASRPCLTIDSAISKLHQRRSQQLNQRARQNIEPSMRGPTPSSSSPANTSAPTITPAQFSILAQKIKETIEAEQASKTGVESLSNEDKKKFQDDLVNLLKKEISAVSKTAKLRFSSPINTKMKTSEQRSLLMKSSPQTLFNTIRRETSLLLNKRDRGNRLSLSLLNDQHNSTRQQPQDNLNMQLRPPSFKLTHTIKVIVPPNECQPFPSGKAKALIDDENMVHSDLNGQKFKQPLLSYQVIKNKIRLFQESNQIILGSGRKFPHELARFSPNLKRKVSSQKSLDKIVDRLQAKWSPSANESDCPNPGGQRITSLQQQIINSSANLLQSSRIGPIVSRPTPIPVFRSPLTATSKGGLYYSGASKIVNMKSKKPKRFYHFGLKIGNYMERECPQPTTDKITIDQFAKCLDLMRPNDPSLRKQQEYLHRSQLKLRDLLNGKTDGKIDRPIRLRRLRGEKVHMPASASYKATRKVGLQ